MLDSLPLAITSGDGNEVLGKHERVERRPSRAASQSGHQRRNTRGKLELDRDMPTEGAKGQQKTWANKAWLDAAWALDANGPKI